MTIKERWAGIVAKLKGARKSLTVWANSAIGVVIYKLPDIAAQLPQYKPLVSASTYEKIALAIIAINIAIRFRTSKGLHEK